MSDGSGKERPRNRGHSRHLAAEGLRHPSREGHVLAHGVDVPPRLFEWCTLTHRRAAGDAAGHIDGVGAGGHGFAAGEPEQGGVGPGRRIAGQSDLVALVEDLEQQGPNCPQPDLGQTEITLAVRIVGEPRPGSGSGRGGEVGPGLLLHGVEGGPADAECHRPEARGQDAKDRLAEEGVGRPGTVAEMHRVVPFDGQIDDRSVVASGTAQADRVPGLVDLERPGRE